MSLYEENILENENSLTKFWNKVEVVHPKDPDACYEWTAKKDKNGCGILCLHCPQLIGVHKYTWKSFRAPRLMWIIEHDQPIPAGLQVLHHCDNESCTNPRHLYLGTQYDNMQDRKARGRFDTGPKGATHPNATLTEAKVRKICHLYFVKGLGQQQVADKLDISRAVVYSIVSGKTWKHITKTHIPKGFLHTYARARARHVKMYQMFKDGWSYKEISEKFGVGRNYVRMVMMKQRRLNGDPPTTLGFRSAGRRKK